MIGWNPNGQVWIAKEIKEITPVVRSSLIYPTYISEGMEAVSTVESYYLYLVNKFKYLDLPGYAAGYAPEYAYVGFSAQAIAIRTTPTLNLVPEYGAVTARMPTELVDGVSGIRLRTTPQLTAPAEYSTVGAVLLGLQYNKSITIPIKNEYGSVTFEITGIELTS